MAAVLSKRRICPPRRRSRFANLSWDNQPLVNTILSKSMSAFRATAKISAICCHIACSGGKTIGVTSEATVSHISLF
jgi:hypothetical protein